MATTAHGVSTDGGFWWTRGQAHRRGERIGRLRPRALAGAVAAAVEALEGRCLLSATAPETPAGAQPHAPYENDMLVPAGRTSAFGVPLAAAAAVAALPGLPVLNSLPSAPVAIYLDFNGGSRNVTAYDVDGNPASFNAAEQQTITDAWRDIANYYSIFNVNVTTSYPGVPMAWAMIGNSISGGYSYVNVFPNSQPESFNQSSDARDRTSGIAHEVGHNFGLGHQADYNLLGVKTAEYSSGWDATHGPIMGVDFARNVHKWFLGHNSGSPSALQDDLAGIAGDIRNYEPAGGDGFRADDFAGVLASATPLTPAADGVQSRTGIIERAADVDAYSFTTGGGPVLIDVNPVAPSGLAPKVEVRSAGGVLLAALDDTYRRNGANNAQQVTIDLPAGTYYLTVASHGSYGDLGPYAAAVRPLRAGWGTADVGPVAVAGHASWNGASGTFTVAGAGSDVWGSSDQFRMTYQRIAGDATIVARVTGVENTDPWAKIGLDLRDSLDANARHAAMLISAGNGPQFLWRGSTGGSTSGVNNNSNTPFAPVWLKLVRSGTTLTGYTSSDGIGWFAYGSATISLNSTIYAGLITCSHKGSVRNAATFDNVAVTGAVVVPPAVAYNPLPAPAGVTASADAGTGVSLAWTAVAGATGYAVERSTDGVTYAPAGTTTATSFNDPGLWGSMRYFYRVATLDGSAAGSVLSAAVSGVNRPSAPTNLTVTSRTNSQLILNWRDASGETGYRIERSMDGVAYGTVATVGANVPSWTDAGRTNGTAYFYRVVPLSGAGDGPAAGATGTTRLPVLTGLAFDVVAAGATSIRWSAVAGATGYRVERSADGTTFTTVTNLPADARTFTDPAPAALSEVYYRVIGTTAQTQSVWPAPIFAAVPAAAVPPVPWQSADVGAVAGAGTTGFAGGTFTMIAAGSDIWGLADQFRFTYQSLTGDGEIVARVATLEDTDGWAKVGVMVRGSTASNAPNAIVALTPDNGVAMQYRTTAGGGSSSIAGPAGTAPRWVRLVRTGTTLTGYTGTNGTAWSQVGSVSIAALGPTVYIGLAGTAHNGSLLNRSTFDNVTVSNAAPTVMTVARATPSPVTGASAALSVLGADDHGEQYLTYQWATTAVPPGAPQPTFSANDTNAAKNATVTFARAGTYTFTVTIRDPAGLTATSAVMVTVAQTPTAVVVAPSPTPLRAGEVRAFVATVTDQFGNAIAAPALTWAVTGAGNGVSPAGVVTAGAPAGRYTVTATAPGGVGGSAAFDVVAVVTGRHVFYNNSAHDGNGAAASVADDGAIATDKAALLPGGTATFANYTSYARGINGVMIDIAGLPGGALSAGAFVLRVGNGGAPGGAWAVAPAPASVTVRPGAGVGGAARVTLVWADGAIRRQWLRVTVPASAASGLPAADEFYFGNAIGETGDSAADALVTTADSLGARYHPSAGPVAVGNVYDFDRDADVDADDVAIARANATTAATALQLITAPAAAAPLALAAAAPTRTPAAPAVALAPVAPTRGGAAAAAPLPLPVPTTTLAAPSMPWVAVRAAARADVYDLLSPTTDELARAHA